MKFFSYLCATSLVLSACGASDKTESQLSSNRFSVGLLGIELTSFSQDELKKFAEGQSVAPISGKLPVAQQTELRSSLARVFKIRADKTNAALTSDAGREFKDLVQRITPAQYSEENVVAAMRASTTDDQLTLLEFLCAYPTEDLKINGLELVNRKEKLKAALLKMEEILSSN